MSYYTGSAANVGAVLTALTSCCETEGWTYSGGILYKADPGIYVRLSVDTVGAYTPLRMWGRSALDSGETPYEVSMCVPVEAIAPTYPVTYHVFVFADEVYMVINYSDKYQWLAFGQSNQVGLVGTGNWIAATYGSVGTGGYSIMNGCEINLTGGSLGACYNGEQAYIVPAIFWVDNSLQDLAYRFNTIGANWYVDSGLMATNVYHPWMQPKDGASNYYLVQLLATQPNAFNNEGVLIPIKVFHRRAESKFSQVLQLTNARHIRVDNYSAGEIIQLGTDYWKVFPWYLKNTASRNSCSMGDTPPHSGTFGWAIKYEEVE